MAPDPDRAIYASFLLRLRWAWHNSQLVYQALLTDVSSKERRGFIDLEGLFACLHAQGPQFEAEPAQEQIGAEAQRKDQSN
jgi:hypothetical protein